MQHFKPRAHCKMVSKMEASREFYLQTSENNDAFKCISIAIHKSKCTAEIGRWFEMA